MLITYCRGRWEQSLVSWLLTQIHDGWERMGILPGSKQAERRLPGKHKQFYFFLLQCCQVKVLSWSRSNRWEQSNVAWPAFVLLMPETRLAVKPHQWNRAGLSGLLHTHDWGLWLPSKKGADLVAADPCEVCSTQSLVWALPAWAEMAPSELSAVAVLYSQWRGN